MPSEILYPLIAVLAIAAAIPIYIFWKSSKRRPRDLKQVSDSLNFTFSENGELSIIKNPDEFRLFSLGNDRKITNVMAGTVRDIPVMVFDYEYYISQDEGTDLMRQTVIALESDRLALPEFALGPRSLLHNIRNRFSHKDINIQTYPNFSKKYWLRGENEEYIRRIFNDRVTEFYEQHPGLSTEGKGSRLICYQDRKLVPASKIQDFIQEGCEIFYLLKATHRGERGIS